VQEFPDEAQRVGRQLGILDPHLRERRLDRQLAGDAGSVGVEDAGADARARQVVDEDLRLGKVRRGEDALQKRIATAPVMPSSLMPLRPEMRVYATPSETQSFTLPRMPNDVVTKDVSGA
jgi:hypothetical protein